MKAISETKTHGIALSGEHMKSAPGSKTRLAALDEKIAKWEAVIAKMPEAIRASYNHMLVHYRNERDLEASRIGRDKN